MTIPVWQRIYQSAAVISPYPQPLTVTALGGSVSTKQGGITAQIMHFATYEDLVAAPAGSAKDKIVYTLHP